MRRKRYFAGKQAFHFIWQSADRDGIWHGDAVSLAEEFDALEDDAESVLDELRDRRLIEKLCAGSFYLSKWREKDDHRADVRNSLRWLLTDKLILLAVEVCVATVSRCHKTFRILAA